MYLSITGVTDDKKLTKYQPCELEADAIVHSAKYGGFVVEDIGGNQEFWIVDKDKKTITEDTATKNSVTATREMETIREHRNGLLAGTDWTGNPDVTMSDAMKTYRQMLRDIPASNTVYEDVDWGTKP
jgi:hypothetical protein